MRTHLTRLTTSIAAASALVAGAALATPAGATAPPSEPPAVTLTPVAEVGGPVDMAWREGDVAAVYVVSQDGTITQISGDATNVVLDITDLTSANGEQGLLGLAFAPAGDKAYVNFTDNNGDTNIAEFAVDEAGVFNRDSLRTVLTIDQPYDNHNGGDLAFGPDGMLYIGTGDGGAGGDPERRAQNMQELLGKMLRIDPSTPSGDLGYTIPADNPFVGQESARGEIWSVGLRNPWRFAFDAETGDLWIADVGQGEIEEIDVAPADGDGMNAGRGLNFGWSGYEGTQVFNSDTPVDGRQPPIYEYSHDSGRCSVSGGARARGDGAGALAGWYVFADYCTGEVFAFPVTGEGTELAAGDMTVIATTDQITAVMSSPTGELYVLGWAGVQRIDPA